MGTKNRKRLAFAATALTTLLGILLVFLPAHAQSKSVTVLRRDAEITIFTNGDIFVEETWETQFSGGPFTFAFRSIPLNKVDDITNWGVREGSVIYHEASTGGTPNTFVLSTENGERKITWYYPPTINQTRTFVLTYTLRGALAIYEEGDQFFWKFIESDRQYTINSSNVIVHLPAEFSPDQVQIASYLNASETADGYLVDGQTVAFSGGPFPGGSEWEIGVRFPHGVVTAAPPRWQYIEDHRMIYSLEALVAALIFLLSGGLGIYLMWYLWGRDKPVGVVPEFFPHPPDDSPPAVAGTLIDERADMEDIIATLIDLARRGYLKIVEQPSIKPLVIESDFLYIRTDKPETDLLPYERRLLRSIFGRKKERHLKELKNKFYARIPDIKKDIYQEVVARGFFSTSPERVRQRYGCLGTLLTVVAGGIAFLIFGAFSEYTPLAICVSGALMVFPLGMLVLSRFMPRKTQKGARAAAQWNAFKRYLANVKKYTGLEQAKDQFEAYLPYAIAFGLEKSWVEQFAPLELPAPVWWDTYYPSHPARGVRRGLARPVSTSQAETGSESRGLPSLDQAAGRAFSGLNSMSSGLFGMLDQASHVLTSAPSASSGGGGFSGGGFSGGGGGGGGSSGFG